ncbi:zinc-dependent alcohol dehydrogenase [Paenibacillus eucommiae]|uniref:Threonine dehydrogenase-like Zn-dependent dehydrogenase n=1 Tax=Paenibacillus eucommiae TaxID=1355755 RepID=A0ABS4J3W7_9BACL|nr:zinc-binding dehydrogenase [Paenibacillus eucommiae]MBP1994537.1 threonine dehydrogenase-like Zn-dependent dehydrogenase [Paenibacillus eucommiae]
MNEANKVNEANEVNKINKVQENSGKNTMKALQIMGVEQAELQEVAIPEPGAGQVLVKVKAVTTCPQWDLHVFYGKPMVGEVPFPFPHTLGQPGHEMTGTIAKLGAGCTLKVGQTVSAWRDQGYHRTGCYAEYVIMEEQNVLAVPDSLHYTKVASLELAMCVAASILRMKQTVGISGKKCGVNGLGPAGLIAVQMLIAEGASEVVGIDPNEQRRELAKKLGASDAVVPDDASLQLRGQAGALQITIDCVGYPQAVHSIMDRTDEAVALFAVQRHPYELYHQGLTVLGYPGHSREAAEYSLQLIIDQKLDMSVLISRELPFESYKEGVELLRSQEAIKICFVLE